MEGRGSGVGHYDPRGFSPFSFSRLPFHDFGFNGFLVFVFVFNAGFSADWLPALLLADWGLAFGLPAIPFGGWRPFGLVNCYLLNLGEVFTVKTSKWEP